MAKLIINLGTGGSAELEHPDGTRTPVDLPASDETGEPTGLGMDEETAEDSFGGTEDEPEVPESEETPADEKAESPEMQAKEKAEGTEKHNPDGTPLGDKKKFPFSLGGEKSAGPSVSKKKTFGW